jgi:hypothetical protein
MPKRSNHTGIESIDQIGYDGPWPELELGRMFKEGQAYQFTYRTKAGRMMVVEGVVVRTDNTYVILLTSSNRRPYITCNFAQIETWPEEISMED